MADSTNKPPSAPVDRHALQRKAREERLAAALRANLKRRKTASRSSAQGEGLADADEEPGGGNNSGR
jgi:hypothetical protein